jgi:hypothetical protein
MKRFLTEQSNNRTIEQSNADIVSHGGLAIMGQAVKQHTNLAREIDSQVPLRHGILVL